MLLFSNLSKVLRLDKVHDESAIVAFNGHGEIEFVGLGTVIQIGNGKANLGGVEVLKFIFGCKYTLDERLEVGSFIF